MAKTTLTGANEQTDWFDLRAVADSVCFNLTGDFVDPVGIRYSNNEALSKGTDYTTGTVYSAAIGPLRFPFGLAKFAAFYSGGSWTAGKTCKPSFAMAKDPNGQLVSVSPQGTGGIPGIG
jgi:hypothetical protein